MKTRRHPQNESTYIILPSEKDRADTRTENLLKFVHVVSEICERSGQTDRQTYRQAVRHTMRTVGGETIIKIGQCMFRLNYLSLTI